MTKRIVLIVLAVLLVIGSVMGIRSCTTVPAGHVGIRFNLYGNDKGVENEVVGPGRYFLSMNEKMYELPTFQQTYVYNNDPNEGSKNDESFTFQTKEGLAVNADVGVTYHIDEKKANILFQTYRQGILEIQAGPLRNIIRDAFNMHASKVPVESAYGEGKTILMDSVQLYVKNFFEPYGLIIDRLYLVGSFRLPAQVLAALNAKIEATQIAQRYENEVAQATAEAQKKIAIARGDSASMVTRASGEAQAMKLKQQTLSELLIRYETAKRWDGQLPTVTGGSIPMISMPERASGKNK